jgi:uncharacterized protein DUF2252
MLSLSLELDRRVDLARDRAGKSTRTAEAIRHGGATPVTVLEPFLGKERVRQPRPAVVKGQRLMQAASDTMLSWIHAKGIDSLERDFYVRQHWTRRDRPWSR